MQLRTLGVIPARYGAQRFPGKPLALIAGQPLVQRVYERARQAQRLDRVVVATDDDRIRAAVTGFGGEVVMTSSACPSGTDRAAEVARQTDAELIVSIQGDEPLMRPEMIDQLVAGIGDEVMATLARPIANPAEVTNPNVVKVVFGVTGQALYFSRHPIPFRRDVAAAVPAAQENGSPTGTAGATTVPHYKHIGIYAYRREFLLQYVQMPQSALEQTEKLEQLRALENGFAIKVLVTPHDSIGVDAPEDVARVEQALAAETRGSDIPVATSRGKNVPPTRTRGLPQS